MGYRYEKRNLSQIRLDGRPWPLHRRVCRISEIDSPKTVVATMAASLQKTWLAPRAG